jgi:hypothetical protein
MRFVGTVPASLLLCPQNDRFSFSVGGEIVSSWVARIDWDSLGYAEMRPLIAASGRYAMAHLGKDLASAFFAAINRTFRLRSLS